MPKLISGWVAVDEGDHCRWGSLRAEVMSARNKHFPFKTRCRLLAWMQASWRACIWKLSCLLSGNDVFPFVDRNVVVMVTLVTMGGTVLKPSARSALGAPGQTAAFRIAVRLV